ncbi:MAG: hypothetical protein VW378_00740 [bacterium]
MSHNITQLKSSKHPRNQFRKRDVTEHCKKIWQKTATWSLSLATATAFIYVIQNGVMLWRLSNNNKQTSQAIKAPWYDSPLGEHNALTQTHGMTDAIKEDPTQAPCMPVLELDLPGLTQNPVPGEHYGDFKVLEGLTNFSPLKPLTAGPADIFDLSFKGVPWSKLAPWVSHCLEYEMDEVVIIWDTSDPVLKKPEAVDFLKKLALCPEGSRKCGATKISIIADRAGLNGDTCHSGLGGQLLEMEIIRSAYTPVITQERVSAERTFQMNLGDMYKTIQPGDYSFEDVVYVVNHIISISQFQPIDYYKSNFIPDKMKDVLSKSLALNLTDWEILEKEMIKKFLRTGNIHNLQGTTLHDPMINKRLMCELKDMRSTCNKAETKHLQCSILQEWNQTKAKCDTWLHLETLWKDIKANCTKQVSNKNISDIVEHVLPHLFCQKDIQENKFLINYVLNPEKSNQFLEQLEASLIWDLFVNTSNFETVLSNLQNDIDIRRLEYLSLRVEDLSMLPKYLKDYVEAIRNDKVEIKKDHRQLDVLSTANNCENWNEKRYFNRKWVGDKLSILPDVCALLFAIPLAIHLNNNFQRNIKKSFQLSLILGVASGILISWLLELDDTWFVHGSQNIKRNPDLSVCHAHFQTSTLNSFPSLESYYLKACADQTEDRWIGINKIIYQSAYSLFMLDPQERAQLNIFDTIKELCIAIPYLSLYLAPWIFMGVVSSEIFCKEKEIEELPHHAND